MIMRKRLTTPNAGGTVRAGWFFVNSEGSQYLTFFSVENVPCSMGWTLTHYASCCIAIAAAFPHFWGLVELDLKALEIVPKGCAISAGTQRVDIVAAPVVKDVWHIVGQRSGRNMQSFCSKSCHLGCHVGSYQEEACGKKVRVVSQGSHQVITGD